MWAAAPAELASRTLPPAATTDPTRRRVVRLAATASGSSRPALLLTAQCPPAAPAGAPGGPTAFASWSQGQGTEMRCSVSRHIPARVTGHCQGDQGQNPVGSSRVGVGGGSHADRRAGLAPLREARAGAAAAASGWGEGGGGRQGAQTQAGRDTPGPAQCPPSHPNA